MTVTPKQLREAADVLHALDTEFAREFGNFRRTYTVDSIREFADERDVPVGTVRQGLFGPNVATYVKVGEDAWDGTYSYEDGSVDRNSNLVDTVVAGAPIVHKPS